jgi:putative radical SAM enzyme (TIGR03279 family)
MKNKFAGQILKNIERLINAGIEIHTQVVLCPGYNDGEILEQTFQDLFKYFPMVKTLAVVPVGVTKNRGALQDLELFTKETALKVIEKVNQWQKMARKKTGKSFIYVGDELYLLANKPIPKAEIYDGFPQLENGIGLARTFIDEWENTKLVTTNNSKQYTKAIIPIGESIYVVIKPLIDEFNKRNNTHHKLLPIKNNFFGDTVNITGLITAVDIKNTLKNDSYNYDVLILPQVILNSDNMFLDGISYEDFVASFDVPVKLAANAYELKNLLNK